MKDTAKDGKDAIAHVRVGNLMRINVTVERKSWNRFRAKSSLAGMSASARLQALIDAEVSGDLKISQA